MAAVTASTRPLRILWDVLEEHFDEGAYGLVCFVRALESPQRTLADLARYPEERLIAQVDGLLLGGAPVSERLLEPALAEADVTEPERVGVAAWALMDAGSFKLLEASLRDERPEVRAALASAGRHVRNAALDAWLNQELSREAAERPVTSLLTLAAARQLAAPGLLAALQSADASLVASAAQVARYGDSAKLLGVVQYLLDHDDARVRDAALIASLAWGSQKAWLDCKRWALDPAQPSALATLLYAALGTRGDHALLSELLRDVRARRSVLFALAFSGNTAMHAALSPFLAGEDALEAKLAAQSLGLIFGFSPSADEYTVPPAPAVEQTTLPAEQDDPEANASLPPLESDDLEADLIPLPEQELPLPNVAAIDRHCSERATRLGTERRVLYGQPFSAEQVANVLRTAPLRVRHGLALSHGVRSAGAVWLDTRAATAVQRAQLARIATSSLQRHAGF